MQAEMKIILSESTGVYKKDIKTQNVEGLENIRFSNNLGGGQGEVDLTLMENYDNTDYSDKQLVEIAMYNKDFPSGFLQYCGFIKNINRKYSQNDGDSIELEILGIGSLLGEYSGTFVGSGAVNTVINSFIAAFHGVYNITTAMEFLGSQVLKNGVTATTNVSVNKTGTYFEILKAIFDSASLQFYIEKDGTIYLGNQSNTEHLLAINKDIVDLKMSSTRETEIKLVGTDYDIKPGDKIFILNVNSNFNMEGSRVEKVEIALTEITLYLGKIWSLGTDILNK